MRRGVHDKRAPELDCRELHRSAKGWRDRWVLFFDDQVDVYCSVVHRMSRKERNSMFRRPTDDDDTW